MSGVKLPNGFTKVRQTKLVQILHDITSTQDKAQPLVALQSKLEYDLIAIMNGKLDSHRPRSHYS